MKREINFWLSLEEYARQVIGRTPLSWQSIGVGMVILVMIASPVNVKNSMAGARNLREAIEMAVEKGDYELGRQLFEQNQDLRFMNQVLGAESELEDKVYPERVVERRIAELEVKLEEYPGNKVIFLGLSSLYSQLGNDDKAREYRERAKILDPNDPMFE